MSVTVTGVNRLVSVVLVVQPSSAGVLSPSLLNVTARSSYERLGGTGGSVVLFQATLNATHLAALAPGGADTFRAMAVVVPAGQSWATPLLLSPLTYFRVLPPVAGLALTVTLTPSLATPYLLPSDAASVATVAMGVAPGAGSGSGSGPVAVSVNVSLVSDLGLPLFTASVVPGQGVPLPQSLLGGLARRVIALSVAVLDAGGGVVAARVLAGAVAVMVPNQRADERTALLAVHKALGASPTSLPWEASAGAGMDPCTWARVTCNTGGFITCVLG